MPQRACRNALLCLMLVRHVILSPTVDLHSCSRRIHLVEERVFLYFEGLLATDLSSGNRVSYACS